MWIACLTEHLPYPFCARKTQNRTTRQQQPYAMLLTISTENDNDSWCRSHWETLRDPQWRNIYVRMYEVWCTWPAHPQYSGQHSWQQVLSEVTRSHCIAFLNGTMTTLPLHPGSWLCKESFRGQCTKIWTRAKIVLRGLKFHSYF